MTRRARIIAALLTVAIVALAFAAPALATSTRREGWFGETNDVNDHERDVPHDHLLPDRHRDLLADPVAARQAQARPHGAAKRRAANADWRGGW